MGTDIQIHPKVSPGFLRERLFAAIRESIAA